MSISQDALLDLDGQSMDGEAVQAVDTLKLSSFHPGQTAQTNWKVLLVDDEDEVHIVSRLALQDFSFAGRHLEFISAHSGAEAKQLIREHPDTAIILLDVVMETDEAGLDVARYIRQELGNHFVRIILRTGQPGLAPERRVLKSYDINDYRAKTELTQDRMFSVIYTALSSYRDLIALARSRHQLIGLVNEIEQLSHLAARDLQNPLNRAVKGVRNLATNPAVLGDVEAATGLKELKGDIYAVQSALNRLVALTSVGRFNESREMVDCNAVMQEVTANLDAQIRKHNAKIYYDALPTVSACRRQLVQLFQNLVSNAISYTDGAAPEVRISAVTHERNWLFSVSDNGRGISPELHNGLFSLFHRDMEQGEKAQETGVGLAICEKIVRWHGGKIWLESEPGQGATFYFTLPLSE
ncbi:hypothetical protein IB286_08190 [Spongiibacter sp. KMU-158]|uniref:histidine kinase n=1 Tax=Spongiibacter pelagi TaxID=2760804 RepID=A0A927C0H4_9GAMM|nr:ATP-binding protein [Spongiibacter pelagi]MBD2858990.1 hypothetical protein [Spongiibacter pelagi]